MQINNDNLVSISDVSQDFSKISRLVDRKGSVVIMKDNCPKYALIDIVEYHKFLEYQESIFSKTSDRILSDNTEAFKKLAE